MKKLALFFAFVFLSRMVAAQTNLKLTLSFFPEKQVLGCAVQPIVRIQNLGSASVDVPDKYTIVGVLRFRVPEGGGISFECPLSFEGTVAWEKLCAGATKEYLLNFEPRVCAADTYSITAEYDDTAHAPRSRAPIRLASGPVDLTYDPPGRTDEEAYNAVVRDILLKSKTPIACVAPSVGLYFLSHPEFMGKFPTSTYAVYAWFGNPGSPRVAMSPEEFLANVHKPGFLTGAFKTDDNRNPISDGKGGYLWRTAEDIQQGIIEQGTVILGQHPNFAYRDELRFRIAQAHIALGQDGQACKLFEVLAKDAASEQDRAKARRYLELLADQPAQGGAGAVLLK